MQIKKIMLKRERQNNTVKRMYIWISVYNKTGFFELPLLVKKQSFEQAIIKNTKKTPDHP